MDIINFCRFQYKFSDLVAIEHIIILQRCAIRIIIFSPVIRNRTIFKGTIIKVGSKFPAGAVETVFKVDVGEHIIDIIVISCRGLKSRDRLVMFINYCRIIIGFPCKVSKVAIDHKPDNRFSRWKEVSSNPGSMGAKWETGKIVFQVSSLEISIIIKIPVEIKMIEPFTIRIVIVTK